MFPLSKLSRCACALLVAPSFCRASVKATIRASCLNLFILFNKDHIATKSLKQAQSKVWF